MKAVLDIPWLPKDWATGTGTVKEVRFESEERQLVVESDGNLYRFSVWGNNWNALIKKWGPETDSWIGKHLFILKEQKPNEKAKITLSPQ